MYDRSYQITPNFTFGEFLVNEETKPDNRISSNIIKVAHSLQTIRDMLGGRQITVVSGYRSPVHNKAVGGAPRSYHLQGLAVDFVVEGMTPQQVQNKLKNWSGGLEFAPTWTHIDLGPYRRFRP